MIYSHGEEIYTDASKSEHGVGIAVIAKNIIICQKLSNQIFMYTAEAKLLDKTINQIEYCSIKYRTLALNPNLDKNKLNN